MKRIEDFNTDALNNLQNIFGGKTERPTENEFGSGTCDVHHDDNDNGTIDPGECTDIVDCPEEECPEDGN